MIEFAREDSQPRRFSSAPEVLAERPPRHEGSIHAIGRVYAHAVRQRVGHWCPGSVSNGCASTLASSRARSWQAPSIGPASARPTMCRWPPADRQAWPRNQPWMPPESMLEFVSPSIVGDAMTPYRARACRSSGALALIVATACATEQWSPQPTVSDDLLPTAGDTTTSPKSVSGKPDRIPPSATVSPANGSPLTTITPVVITFSETMARSSLTLGGSFAPGASIIWSSASVTDDRITVTPTTAWMSGPGTLTVDGSDLAGNSLTQLQLGYNVDSLPPTAVASPVDYSNITTSTSIVITFSETMARSSLTLGGSFAPGASIIWSSASMTDDRITVTPTTAWMSGPGTLTVDGSDLAGNPLAHLQLTYSVGS